MKYGYKQDVKIVAEALIEDSVVYMNSDYNDGYYCEYCDNGYQDGWRDFKHKLGCPVLVARDLLTRSK